MMMVFDKRKENGVCFNTLTVGDTFEWHNKFYAIYLMNEHDGYAFCFSDCDIDNFEESDVVYPCNITITAKD